MFETHIIKYQSLSNEGRVLYFPCDKNGCVHLDALSDRARQAYLYARAVVGRQFAFPSVIAAEPSALAH